MKKEELKRWRESTEEEIKNKVFELEKHFYELKKQSILGQLKNYSQFREIKKDIARLKTIINENKKRLKNDKKS